MSEDIQVIEIETPTSLTPVARERGDGTLGFLCFLLGDQEFGVDLHLISQIVQVPPITPVPRTKSYYPGVISVRGKVVTVVDFRQLVGMAPATIDKNARILLYETPDEHFGLLVDQVTLVRRVGRAEFEENPVLEENPATEKVVGIVRTQDAHVTIIDLEDIMAEAIR